jgi:hypothetical protein
VIIERAFGAKRHSQHLQSRWSSGAPLRAA